MSDNVTPFVPKPQSGRLLKRIVLLAAIAVLICAVVAAILFRDQLNMDGLRRWIKYLNVSEDKAYGTFSFDSHNSNQYANWDDGLAVASVGGLNTYESSGEEQYIAQMQLSLPEIQTGGDLVMSYDVGGTSLLAVDKHRGEVLRLTEEQPILDASISSEGAIAYASSASGYKSVLTVYNNAQERIYRWLSSTSYMPLCTVSPKAEWLAAVALGQNAGSFESVLCLFRTDEEQMHNSITLGNQLIYDLSFVDEEVICAVGETSVQFFDLQANLLGSYTYQEQYLKDYDFSGDGFLTLSVNMYRAGNRYSLLTVDERGQEIASVYVGQEILDLSACGKYLAVLTLDGLTIYNQSLVVYSETEEIGNATSVLMREDGSALLLGGGEGSLYIP